MGLQYGLAIWFCGLATLFLCTPSASALSCAPPNLMQAMEEAKTSDQSYYILVGTFSPDPNAPQTTGSELVTTHVWPPRPPIRVPVRTLFEGYSLTADPRADVHLSQYPVLVQTACVGSWCSSAPLSGGTKIAFVQVNQGPSPVLSIKPCGDKIFELNRQEDPIRKLRSCFDRPCTAERKGGLY